MLNSTLEKQNEERLIFKKEIPIKTTLDSPFENTEDIMLSGDFSFIKKDKVEIKIHSKSDIPCENVELQNAIKENQMDYAAQDLRRIPQNPFLLNNLGLVYLNNKQYEKALSAFSQAIEIKPDFVQATLNLAFLYVLKENYNSAMDILNTILKREPNDIKVLNSLGNIYFKQKNFKFAKDIYKKIVKIEPKNIASRNRLALINLIEGKFAESISELRQCLQTNNNLPAIYNNLGVAYGMLKAYKKSIQSFKIALNIYPIYSSATYNLAVALQQKNIGASIELLENYLSNKENNKMRELLAKFYFENRDFKKALKNLSMVLLQLKHMTNMTNSNKEIARIYNNIGVIYHVIRNFEKAIENYLACIAKIDCPNHIIVGNIIDLYFDLNQFNRAKKYIDMYREQFGEKEFYFYYLSRYSYYKTKLSDSIKFMKQFLMINKTFLPAYTFLSHIYSEHLQDYKKAVALNLKAFEYLPNNMAIINNLAYSYLMNNEVNKADIILGKVEKNVGDVFLNATRGLLNIKKGNIEEGTRLYNLAAKFTRLKPLSVDVIQKKHLELARYYFSHGQNNMTRDNLKKVFSTMKGKDTVFTKHAQELQAQLLSERNTYLGPR